jgi:hypothetical protein
VAVSAPREGIIAEQAHFHPGITAGNFFADLHDQRYRQRDRPFFLLIIMGDFDAFVADSVDDFSGVDRAQRGERLGLNGGALDRRGSDQARRLAKEKSKNKEGPRYERYREYESGVAIVKKYKGTYFFHKKGARGQLTISGGVISNRCS